MRFSVVRFVALFAVIAGLPKLARGADDWLSLMQQLPAGANAVMLADVQALRAFAAQHGKNDEGGEQAIRDLSAELTPDVRKLAVSALQGRLREQGAVLDGTH